MNSALRRLATTPNRQPARPRIGIAGFFLEANRFAPLTTGAMFDQTCDLAGEQLLTQLRAQPSRTLPDCTGFVAAMDAATTWQPVPLRLAAAYPGGPVEGPWFEGFLNDMAQRLQAALPLDGVFISSHGAALSTGHDDPDGELYALIRRIVGPTVPVVAVLDLHCNVSPRMCAALSALVAYRSNPHVDLFERGQEAGALLCRMLSEGPGEVALVKLPFLPASTDQLIAPGTAYQQSVQEGQQALGGDILNVSMCGGFALADCNKCGFSVVVTARQGQHEAALSVAKQLAAGVWGRRHQFLSQLTPLALAVQLAVDNGLQDSGEGLILADVADNPGGGGGGNTTALLRALLQAGAQGVLLAVFCDPPLAQQAHRLGVGQHFEAAFNSGAADDVFAQPLQHRVRVVALSDGEFVGRQGLVKGSRQQMGPTALLDLGGVQVAVISRRQQLLDPAQLDVLQVDLRQVRTLVVKSRGHFRAAFDGFAPEHRIIEVDGPGLTTPNLASLPLKHLPRPIFPLDPDMTWQP